MGNVYNITVHDSGFSMYYSVSGYSPVWGCSEGVTIYNCLFWRKAGVLVERWGRHRQYGLRGRRLLSCLVVVCSAVCYTMGVLWMFVAAGHAVVFGGCCRGGVQYVILWVHVVWMLSKSILSQWWFTGGSGSSATGIYGSRSCWHGGLIGGYWGILPQVRGCVAAGNAVMVVL